MSGLVKRVWTCPECSALAEYANGKSAVACRVCGRKMEPVRVSYDEGGLKAKRAWFTMKSGSGRSVVAMTGKTGKWKDFSVLPGKKTCYAALLSGAEWLMETGKLEVLSFPGENDFFEKQLMGKCMQAGIPLSMYLVERDKAVYEKVRRNFAGIPGVYMACAELARGELSQPMFQNGQAGVEVRFPDLASRLNLVWLDYQGMLSSDNMFTVVSLLNSSQMPRVVLGVTVGNRGRDTSPMEVRELVEAVTTGPSRLWDLKQVLTSEYPSGPNRVMKFVMFELQGCRK